MILLLCAWLTLANAAEVSLDPIAIEKRIGQFQLQYETLAKVKDWPGALETIRQAASLDPDHPKPYLLVVLLQSRRGAREEAGGIMDGLGAPKGPGRIYGEGLALFMSEKHAAAAEAFKRALDQYRERNHAAGQAACHTGLGNVDRQANRLDEAMIHYQAAGHLLDGVGDRLGKADVLSSMAKLERQAGRPKRAAERQFEVLRLREALGDESGQARSWHDIGVSLSHAGEPEGAMEALDHALAIRRASGDRAAEASSLRVMGEVHLSEGRDREALAVFQDAVTLDAAIGDRQNEAATKSWIGRTLRRLGEFEKAREVLESGLAQAVKLKDATIEAALLTDLAAVRTALWEIGDALVAGQRALELNRRQANKRGELTNQNSLGGIYHALGETALARRHVEAALQLAQELSDDSALARGRNNLGVLLAQAGDPNTALNELQEAESLWQKSKDARGAAASQANIAEVLISQGRLQEAERRLSAGLNAFKESGDRLGESSAMNQMADLRLKTGHAKEAAAAFREALESAGRFGLAEEEWRARAGLATAHDALGRHDEAIKEAMLALDRIDGVRARLPSDTFKIRFLAGRMALHELALSLVLAGDKRLDGDRAAQALRIVERARARGLSDLLAESRARLRDSVPADLRRREEQALDRINAATVRLIAANGADQLLESHSELSQSEEMLQRIELEMRTSVPRYAEMVYPQPAAVAAIQAVLMEDEILLEYFVGARHAWVWQVTRRAVSVLALCSPGEIRKAVSAFQDQSSTAGAALGAKRSQAGAELLAGMLLPTSKALTGKRLVVVPDGPLHHVPFEALSRKGRFLIEDHEVTVVPSASTLLLMRALTRSRNGKSFLGIGDPTPGGDAMPALPFSRVEVERIAGLFGESSRTVLTGSKASRTSLKGLDIGKYAFVHFATHGLFRTGERQTGLWLGAASEDKSDSILSLQDILTLRMDADLVVLSACQSGLGELVDGEGLVSLTRAFLHAGARSVVVALWNVSDDSTMDFMGVFYSRLLSGESPAAALRSAKLSFIRSDRPARQEAYRWAPFILVGLVGEAPR